MFHLHPYKWRQTCQKNNPIWGVLIVMVLKMTPKMAFWILVGLYAPKILLLGTP